MKTHKLLTPILSLGLLVLSCSKDSAPSLTTTQAQKALGDVNTNLASDISGLNTAPGNVALNSFTNLTSTTSPFGRIRSFSKPGDIKDAMSASVTSIRQMILKGSASERVQGDTPFDFASKKGIYVYNFTTQKFDKSQTTSDIIKIDYPKDDASKANSINNAELQITAYTETFVNNTYNPTLVQAAIYIDQVKQVELKLTAGYDASGDPNKESIDLFINPYTISFSVDNSPATSGTETFSLSKNGATLIGTGFTALFPSAAVKASGGNPSSLTGYIQLKNVRFNAAVDGTKTSTSKNDFIVITVTADGAIAGHVVWVADQAGDEQPYIQYNDKTQPPVPLSTVFADLKSQLETLVNG